MGDVVSIATAARFADRQTSLNMETHLVVLPDQRIRFLASHARLYIPSHLGWRLQATRLSHESVRFHCMADDALILQCVGQDSWGRSRIGPATRKAIDAMLRSVGLRRHMTPVEIFRWEDYGSEKHA